MSKHVLSNSMIRGALRGALLLPFPWILAGCSGLKAEITQLKQSVAQLKQQQDEINKELNRAWSIILCGDKLSELFQNVDKECSTTAAPESSDPKGASCSTNSIGPSVMEADDTHRGMFLDVMRPVASEVFPVGNGAKELPEHRRKKLTRLAAEQLRTTRFLVVARMPPKDADKEQGALQRSNLVIAQLRALKIPEERIRRWTYNFPMSKQDIMKYTGQLKPGEPGDYNYGVWVFRVNC